MLLQKHYVRLGTNTARAIRNACRICPWYLPHIRNLRSSGPRNSICRNIL